MYHYLSVSSEILEISHFFFWFFMYQMAWDLVLAPMIKVEEQHIFNAVVMYILEYLIAVYFPKISK